MSRRVALIVCGVSLGLGLWGFEAEGERDAWAQKPKARPPVVKAGRDAGAREAGAAPVEAPPAPVATKGVDASVVESKTVDGGRVFKFGELEVEGRLRSPQIVYFLRRVRAEFAAGDLGHRSFMGELSQTRSGTAF